MNITLSGRRKQRSEIPQDVDFYALFTLILRHLSSTLAGVARTRSQIIMVFL
jgi:hypothetical protein